jgi:hypothetical protein
MGRAWAMPSADTFSVRPIGDMVRRYLRASRVSIDPFARNSGMATHTNDLNTETSAHDHMDAAEWMESLAARGVVADLMLFDPPYSPRQISEVYAGIGRAVTTADTQSAALYSRVRDAAMRVLSDDAIVLSFGWNSVGMGSGRGFDLLEVLMVCHGGAHNDTICLAERRAVVQRTMNLTAPASGIGFRK